MTTPRSCRTCKSWKTLRLSDNWGRCLQASDDPDVLGIKIYVGSEDATGGFNLFLQTRDVHFCGLYESVNAAGESAGPMAETVDNYYRGVKCSYADPSGPCTLQRGHAGEHKCEAERVI